MDKLKVSNRYDCTAKQNEDKCDCMAKRNEERFIALIKATSDVVYSMSPDWQVMTTLYGAGLLADTEEPDPNWRDKYICLNDRGIVSAVIRSSIAKKKPFELEHRVLKSDGNIGWVMSRAIPILDENGNISEWFGVASNITERKGTEGALRESEERFRTVLENSMDGIGMFNIQTGRFDYINPALAGITGFTVEELGAFNPQKVFARVHPDNLPEILQLQEGSKNEETVEIELQWKVKSGEYRWFNKRSRLVFNWKNEPIYRVIICRDITEHKQAEQEFRESKKRDLNLVGELEEINRSKNRFISVLSHELKNSLAAIHGGVQLLDMAQYIEHTLKAREIIKRQTDRLCRLTDDLLELARISQNKIDLKKRNISLNKIVKDTMEDVLPKYMEKGVGLGMEIQAEPVFLNADPVRIAQVIENILSNALKFTQEDGTVWLTLRAERDHAVISIKDNGIGIDPGILPYLFTPFTQADDALDRSSGGLGLGLSIVKGIVDLHGGAVDAYSEGLGKGSTFTIRLPVAQSNKEVEFACQGS